MAPSLPPRQSHHHHHRHHPGGGGSSVSRGGGSAQSHRSCVLRIVRWCFLKDALLIAALGLFLVTVIQQISIIATNKKHERAQSAPTTNWQSRRHVRRLRASVFRQNSTTRRREQDVVVGLKRTPTINANNTTASLAATTMEESFRDAIYACPQHQKPITFSNVSSTTHRNKYQLGDIVKFYRGAESEHAFTLPNGIRPCSSRRFNHHSIACSYVRTYRHSGTYPNMEVLDEVTPLVEPRPEAVMHLRLGDIAKGDCWKNDCISSKLRSGNKLQYQFTEKDYDTIRDELKDLGTITIVANPSHLSNPSTIAWSEKYINHVMAYLRRLGVCPVYRGIRDADDDFAFATSAKVFVQGGGGYSRFMANLVMKRGGRVLTPGSKHRSVRR